MSDDDKQKAFSDLPDSVISITNAAMDFFQLWQELDIDEDITINNLRIAFRLAVEKECLPTLAIMANMLSIAISREEKEKR